jgi:hypothetical protein
MQIVDERHRCVNGYILGRLEEFELAFGDEVLAAAGRTAVDNTWNEKKAVIAADNNLHDAKKLATRTIDDSSCLRLRGDVDAHSTSLALGHSTPCMVQEEWQLHWYREQTGLHQACKIHYEEFAANTACTDPPHCIVHLDRDNADALVVEVEPMQ